MAAVLNPEHVSSGKELSLRTMLEGPDSAKTMCRIRLVNSSMLSSKDTHGLLTRYRGSGPKRSSSSVARAVLEEWTKRTVQSRAR